MQVRARRRIPVSNRLRGGRPRAGGPLSAPLGESVGLEPLLAVHRRHAAAAGGGDRLAVDVILDVAAGEDAEDVRLGAIVSKYVAGRVEI